VQTLLSLLSMSAVAAPGITAKVDFPVVQDAPVFKEVITSDMLFDVAAGFDDREVQSDWAHVVCIVRNGIVMLRFQAARDQWPESWPAAASCSDSELHPDREPGAGTGVAGL